MTRAKDISKIVTDADLSGTLDVTGNLTVDTNTLFVDSANNRVGIGTASSLVRDLNINGTAANSKAFVRFSHDGLASTGLDVGYSSAGYASIYNAENTAMVFSTNASEAMRIDSSGNVGIGTTSPNRNLSVAGVISAQTSANDASILLLPTASENRIYSRAGDLSTTALDLTFRMGDTERMRIDSSGNVGIGTTTPNTTNLNSGTTSGIVVKSGGVAKNNFVALPSTGGSQWDVRESGGSGGEFTMRMFDTSGTHNVQISSNGNHFFNGGNVGIGTSSPAYELEVKGSGAGGYVRVDNTVAGNSGDVRVSLAKNGTTFGDIGQFASSDFVIRSQTSIGFITNNQNFSNGTRAVTIDSSGNLLVGKTTTALATAGITLGSTGFGSFTRSGLEPLNLNRLSSDGDIAVFYKDGSPVGSIGVSNSDNLYIYGNATGHTGINFGTNQIIPASGGSPADNTVDLGNTSNYFKDVLVKGGIRFGTYTSANYLDSYEEGTFVPVLSATTTAGSYTGTTTAKYTKVGNLVQIEIQITFTTFSVTPNGNWRLSNLPFVPLTGGNAKFHLTFYNVDIDTTNHHVWHAYPTSASNIQFLFYRDNSTWVLGSTGNFQIGDGDIIGVSGTYLSA